MILYRIRSKTLRQEGARSKRIEGIDYARMQRRLREVQKVDPEAKLLRIEVPA